MLKSKDEVYLKPLSFKSKPCVLRIGNGFLLILIFSSLNRVIKQLVSFFLGSINVGAAHSGLFLRFKTLYLLIYHLLFLEFLHLLL